MLVFIVIMTLIKFNVQQNQYSTDVGETWIFAFEF